jgi:hypothetical protein
MALVFTLNRKCIHFKNMVCDAPGLWCKQVVHTLKTPIMRDIARDNTVLSRAISTLADGTTK